MQGYPQPPPQKPKSSTGTVLLVVGIIGGVLLFGGGIFAVLGIYGVRKYIANAKTAEARATLQQIGRDARAAYERDHKLCPSASSPVPADKSLVSGRKYQSARTEWTADTAKEAGWACLKFEMVAPQYFQYEYEATPDGFTAYARGDLNGDGRFSQFSLAGHVRGDELVVDPSILERDPEE